MTKHSPSAIAAAVPRARVRSGVPDLLTQAPSPSATTDPAAGCPRQALLTLAAEEDQVRTAREFTAAVLGRWHMPADDRDSVVLIVSELATNAVLHGGSEMTVRLALGGDILHVAVTDCGATPARRPERPGGDPVEHGRGLGIVECLAHWTDVRQEADGRQVHAHLLLTPPHDLPAVPADHRP
ncbi:ATP-binding protein [Streptomyces ficellus]|uniref:ATP-binding protein n=1 Tax=Streptomyces ficellus TaxID=1977088 RepID=A0A6I6F2N4_9ACTN|nr:ATP-binding protein [Streptomyces ficellus]QGV77031.1 ATP-binding protein [Streptomyces ficellus]